MPRVLIANDETGVVVWSATLADLDVDVAAVVHSVAGLMAALGDDCGVEIVLVSGMGLGMPVVRLVQWIRESSPHVAILAVPARGESAAELVRQGADAVLAGAADPDARELAVGQAVQAQGLRQELARANRVAGSMVRKPVPAGTVTPELAEVMLDNVLERASRTNAPVSVLAVEADYFNQIVARKGPSVRQEIGLQLVARVRELVRSYDVLALVDDRCVLVTLFPCTEAVAAGVATRLQIMTSVRPMQIGGEPMTVQCSIGVACHEPLRGPTDAQRLIDRAGEAVVDAKLAGGGRVVLSEISIDELQREVG
jgi:diguanylate cyclase (GGDEF)-like protein